MMMRSSAWSKACGSAPIRRRSPVTRNGATLRALDHPGDTASIDWVDEDFNRDEGGVHYYLRVQQKNLQIA